MALPVPKTFEKLLSRMRFPQLFLLLGALFVADFFFPDPILFVDEIMLLVLTVMAGMWKKDRKEDAFGEADTSDGRKPSEKNVTPES